MEAVARRGKRFRFAHFEVRLLAAESGPSRIGLIVPKHGQSAVRRNRLKRRLREWARLDVLPQLAGGPGATQAMQVVIRARASAYQARGGTVREELEKMASAIVRFATQNGPV